MNKLYIIGAINELKADIQTKVGNYGIERCSWVDEYRFTMVNYGHYLIIISKGTSTCVGVAFNFSSGPSVARINNQPNTISLETSSGKLKVSSTDGNTFYATCVNIS